jgi:DNA-binding transcriptional ArsR family regulator
VVPPYLRSMSVEFLTDDEAAYGRYAGAPSQADLERVFFLDDEDRTLVDRRPARSFLLVMRRSGGRGSPGAGRRRAWLYDKPAARTLTPLAVPLLLKPLVLLALGQAAMVSGSSVTEFGCRNLALHSALSSRTVSRVLRMLRDEPDPLIDLVSLRRLARADRYALRIPDAYADSVRWRRRRAGRVDAAHPAFLVLGGAAALTYQALGLEPARGAEVARAARLSPSAVSAALRVLAEHGLAERGPGGWRRAPVSLDAAAAESGAADLHRERAERYQRDRESWRSRLRQYQGARYQPVSERDGWWSLDDPDEYDFAACRWPVLADDVVRGPPGRLCPAESA